MILDPSSLIVVSVVFPKVYCFSTPGIAFCPRNLVRHLEGFAVGAESPLLSGCQRTSTALPHTRYPSPERARPR